MDVIVILFAIFLGALAIGALAVAMFIAFMLFDAVRDTIKTWRK